MNVNLQKCLVPLALGMIFSSAFAQQPDQQLRTGSLTSFGPGGFGQQNQNAVLAFEKAIERADNEYKKRQRSTRFRNVSGAGSL